jgi:excisionase family DNA binding protein
MDVDLWTYAEAARQVDVSERTIRRMVSDGDLHRYWWGSGSARKGPRVSAAEVQAIWNLETASETWHGKYRFRANRPKRGFVEIVDEAGTVSGAVVYWDAPIDQLAPHPDGVLVWSGGQVGVVSRNTKGCWTFSLLPPQDLESSGHEATGAA